MNIFFLSLDPKQCAQWHCNKHVIKMILESVQLLCSAHHICPAKTITKYVPPYKLTHKNHPCSKWVRESLNNYIWLCKLTVELLKEYTYRYGKIHKCEQEGYISDLISNIPDLPDKGFTPPAQAMPDSYKSNDVVESYQQYYYFEKFHLLEWDGKVAGRSTPDWIKDLNSEGM